MIGISIRLALSLGLHLRNEDPTAEKSKRESLIMTWWSLHAIECLVSSITGRPPIVAVEDCTVSFPTTTLNEQSSTSERSATRMRRNSYSSTITENRNFVAHIKIALISQKGLLNLYSPRTAAHSWEVSVRPDVLPKFQVFGKLQYGCTDVPYSL